jgi:predicted ATPase
MAHITEITIEGLLGNSESIHLKLNRDVNVFFGENGCGKTTLLKVLDAALSIDGSAMAQLPVTKAVVDIYSINAKRVIRHTWERDSKNRDSERLRQLALLDGDYQESAEVQFLLSRAQAQNEWKQSPKGKSNSSWSHTFLPTTRLYFGGVGSRRLHASTSNLSEGELDQAFAESVKRAWLQFYSKTLSDVRTVQESGLVTVLKHVLDPSNEDISGLSVDSSAVYDRVARFLSRQPQSDRISLGSQSAFKRRYEKDANLRKIVDNLNDMERSIEQAMVPINRFLDTITRLFSKGKSLQLSDNGLQVFLADGRSLPIAQLSSGEKHLIKILLYSMSAGPNSVLIDEPELSLHIDWQRLFIQTIHSLNPECQLILASHSPEVMADIPDANIFRL